MKGEINLFLNKELMCLWDDVEDDFTSISMKLDRLKKDIDNIKKLIKERRGMVKRDFIKLAKSRD